MEKIGNGNSRRRGASRGLSSEEVRLWQRSTADVRPLSGRSPFSPLEPQAPEARDAQAAMPDPVLAPIRASAPARSRSRTSDHELAPGIASGIDRRTVVRLRRGLLAPETQIDLHQCTQAQAYDVLQSFLAASQIKGRRCVLVITGKGYGPQGAVGILKTMVPRWLNEQPNRDRVLAFSHATPAHGGEGALYVLLRRLRPR